LLRFFRYISLAEGISLLTLLFIAMPMKYMLNIPEAVKIVGWIHGVLFIVYVTVLVLAEINYRWSLLFFAAAFLASLVPFGTFVLDRYLKKLEVR